jgi:PIN domain nuclease of toxin-antitoxin system
VADVVLDASAVLALLNRERGWEMVEAVLADAAIAAPNLAEVLTKLSDAGVPDKEAWNIVSMLDLECVPFSAGHAREAARRRASTRALGLSLGDRACLALGRALKRPVYTADKSWATLDVGVYVYVLR